MTHRFLSIQYRFLSVMGFLGSIFYNLSLSIYYVCLVCFSMQEQRFRKTIEPWCHFVANSIPISASIFLLIKQSFNFGGKACFITAYPRECMYNDDIVCERGSKRSRAYWIFGGGFLILVTLIIFLNMIAIIVKVVKQKKKSDRWRLSNTEDEANESLLMRILYCCCFNCKGSEKANNQHDGNQNIDPDPTIASSRASNSNRIGKHIRSLLKFEEKQTSSKKVAFKKDVEANESDLEEGKDAEQKNKDEEDNSKEEEIQIIRAAALVEKSNANTSRSGTNSDPLAFDLRKVRKSIRHERRQTLDHLSSDKVEPTISSVVEDPIVADSTNVTRSREKSDEEKAAIHALLYMGTFFICYIFSIVARIVKASNSEEPFVLAFLTRTMVPLQGFLFIMVYCRPNVLSLRKNNPEQYSRLKAFWMVLKSGGDQDPA